MKSTEERFWGRVDKQGEDGCWVWTGAVLRGGYGNLHINNHTVQAHRYSYELHFGEIPEGMFVCHKCDNPSCVNPSHLFLGTNLDNSRDRVNKGRQARWEHHSKAKLDREQVLRIRRLYSSGNYSMRDLAKLFGISYTNTNGIINERYWKGI